MVEIIKTFSLVEPPTDMKIYGADNQMYTNLLNNNALPKFISFDGEGIDLLDNNKNFYTEGDFKGYVSSVVSDENCLLDSDEANIFTLHETTLIPEDFEKIYKNITIAFYGDCCREVKVTYDTVEGYYYEEIIPVSSNLLVIKPNCSAIIDEIHKTFDPEYTQRCSIISVLFEFTKTRIPNQSIKIASIKLGDSVVYNKLKNIELLEEINVLSEDMPINELNFSILLPNLENNEEPFEKNDLINIYSNNTFYGSFYVSESERIAKNTYSVKAQNSICILEKTNYREWGLEQTLEESEKMFPNVSDNPHLSRPVTGGNGMNILNFTSVISKLTSIEFLLPDEVTETEKFYTEGNIPINTCRYALCLFAFANGFMVDASRSDKIHIKSIPQNISSIITTADKRIIGECTFSKTAPITKAELQFKTYNSNKVESLENITYKNAVTTARYNYCPDSPVEVLYTPYSSKFLLQLNSPNIITFIIKEFDVADNGNGETEFYLPIYKIVPDIEEYAIINANSTTAKSNVKDFTKLNLKGSIKNVRANVEKFIKSRGIAKGKIRLRGEKVGDLIQIETAYDGIVTGIITSMNIRFGYEDIAEIEVLEWPIG